MRVKVVSHFIMTKILCDFNYLQNVFHVKYSTVFFFQLNSNSLQNIYSISYLYFGALSTSAVVLVGVVVSYITGESNSLTLLLTQ